MFNLFDYFLVLRDGFPDTAVYSQVPGLLGTDIETYVPC